MSPKAAETQAARDEIAGSSLFDPSWYVAAYPDVASLQIDPAMHFLLIGGALDRNPSTEFDTQAYRPEYEDVGEENPLLHYLRKGKTAGYLPKPSLFHIEQDLLPPLPFEPGQTSHLPGALRRKCAAMEAMPWPKDANRSYRTSRAFFDAAFYITRYYDMAKVGPHFDLCAHFVRSGVKEERSPNPHFSLRHYRSRYGKMLQNEGNLFEHWVTKGRKAGMIAHELPEFEDIADILGLQPAVCQEKLIARKADLRQRLEFGTLGEMVNKAIAFDVLVSQTWRQALAPNVQPFHNQQSATRLVATHALQKAADFRQAKAVICVNAPRWGNNRRLEGHLAFSLSEIYGPENVILMNTDKEGVMPSNKAPAGVRCIDFAALTEKASSTTEKQRLLLEFLRSLRALSLIHI